MHVALASVKCAEVDDHFALRRDGQISNELRTIGAGSKPPSLAIWVKRMRTACRPAAATAPACRGAGFGRPTRLHQLELVDPGDRRVEEAQAVLPPLDVQHRERLAVDGKDVADEAAIGVVLEEGLPPPFGCVSAAAGVEVPVRRHAVVEQAVVEGERDVVVDREGAVRMVAAHARQPQPFRLVAGIQLRLLVVNRVEADQPL